MGLEGRCAPKVNEISGVVPIPNYYPPRSFGCWEQGRPVGRPLHFSTAQCQSTTLLIPHLHPR